MPHLLQINYKFSVPRAEFESGFDAVASQIAQVLGSVEKFGSSMRAESCGGGIYLFDDEESAPRISRRSHRGCDEILAGVVRT
jgi:hypothetical protein